MELQETFDRLFKFKINEDVRHRGDTKGIDADMGLLVLGRHLTEEKDGDGNMIYSRSYLCRMIRFSGSGDLARFNENELMSTGEYLEKKLERDKHLNEMRTEAKMVEREVQELFGITKEDYLYEVVNGEPDTTRKFRMSGFSSSEDGVKLLVTESLFTASNRKGSDDKMSRERREWTSKDNFIKVS